MSLNNIEHDTIRPTFKEPRIHVALVCAARSCPAIRGEAYIGSRIQGQLQDQSLQFANNLKYVAFDAENNELKLSPILNWYGDDWKGRYPNGSYLAWLKELSIDPAIKEATSKAAQGSVAVKFVKYDWTLNSQAEPGKAKAGPKKSGGFGSGSSPDE